MTTEPNEGSTGTPPNSTDRREARETVLSVVRTAGTRIRRDPALAVPFAVAGVVVALADWLRRRGPVPFARPGWFGDTVSVQYSMFPSGTARTIRYVDALVDLREPYLLGAVALELAAWLAVGIAGWLTVVRALNAEHRSRPLLRYLSVSVVVGVLPALLGPSTVEFDALPIGLLVLFVSALVATSLFLVPGTVVTGYPVATALRESVRRSRGRRWSLLGLVACFGLASWGLARVPVAGGFLSTAVVGPIHAVSLAVLLRKNG